MFAAAIQSGCERAGDVRSADAPKAVSKVASTSFSKGPCRYASLKSGDTIVRVNGKDLTKADLWALFSFRCQLWQLQQKQTALAEPDEASLAEAAASMIMEMIHHELFRQYAEKTGIRPSPEEVARAEKDFMMALRRPAGEKFEKVERLFVGDAVKILRRVPYEDARDHLLRKSVTTNDLDNVSEAELQGRIRFVKGFDANAERLNEESRKLLRKARAEILAGADFAEVTRRVAQVERGHGKKWETYQLAELPQDEDLVKWLRKAKVGEISQPLDVADGLAIVKLVRKKKGAAPPGAPAPVEYELVKCTARAYEHMQYQDRPTMIRQLLTWKREEAQQILGTKLMGEAKIEYPNGTELFENEGEGTK